jgi:hypothetical protein
VLPAPATPFAADCAGSSPSSSTRRGPPAIAHDRVRDQPEDHGEDERSDIEDQQQFRAVGRSTTSTPGPGMPEDTPNGVGSDRGIRQKTAIERHKWWSQPRYVGC